MKKELKFRPLFSFFAILFLSSMMVLILPALSIMFFILMKSWAWSISYFMYVLKNFTSSNKNLMSMSMFSISLIMMLIYLNLSSLLPFMISMTSVLLFSACLGVVLWGLVLLSGFKFNFKKSMAHLAPSGAPLALIPFLVLIETVSIMIRPLTLTVRLVANMSMGHIVLSLIACMSKQSMLNSIIVSFFTMLYIFFEFFVCFIQAYIFTLLISLYSEEHP